MFVFSLYDCRSKLLHSIFRQSKVCCQILVTFKIKQIKLQGLCLCHWHITCGIAPELRSPWQIKYNEEYNTNTIHVSSHYSYSAKHSLEACYLRILMSPKTGNFKTESLGNVSSYCCCGERALVATFDWTCSVARLNFLHGSLTTMLFKNRAATMSPLID